jgi:hypothetical protein
LTSGLVGGKWSASRPGRFIPGETAPGTHCAGGCVGPRAGLDAVQERKISFALTGIEPRPSIAIPTELSRLLKSTVFWEVTPYNLVDI